jgi:2-polyprenyl-6-methoxyphenol hydroxylase-like FAD-dependent oxidoreductase
MGRLTGHGCIERRVGAGIGGLTAAIALRRRGVNVAVYEKAHELRELGPGVTRRPDRAC